jgi:hypothetical protein
VRFRSILVFHPFVIRLKLLTEQLPRIIHAYMKDD